MRSRRKLLFGFLTAGLVLAVVETASCTFFHVQRERFTFYAPERYAVDDDDLEKLASYHDPTLGWKKPYPSPFGERPREREYPSALLATFGDSYTHCDEVEDDETWQTYLSRSIGQTVYNFGVGGYGTDQAYLRFREDYPKVRTPVVALGFTSDNIKRVVNVYRKFFYRNTGIPATKPRFVLEDGGLRLIENPIRSVDELPRLKDPAFLRTLGRHDLWYNKDDDPVLRFPYTAILFHRGFWREVRHSGEIDDVDPRPWEDLWQHPDSRQIMFRLFDRFVADAREWQAEPIVMILPKRGEVLERFRTGRPPDAIRRVRDYTASVGYEVFDGVEALATAAASEREILAFYDGHLSAAGNEALARALHAHLQGHGHL